MTQSIHQEVVFKTSPDRIYQALMTQDQHAAFTGAPAEISAEVGGAFACHGGQVVGRQLELLPNQRIVQAWRIAAWDDGIYSVVRFELAAEDGGTRLTLDHSGVPEAAREAVAAGWKMRYWEPLAKYLA